MNTDAHRAQVILPLPLPYPSLHTIHLAIKPTVARRFVNSQTVRSTPKTPPFRINTTRTRPITAVVTRNSTRLPRPMERTTTINKHARRVRVVLRQRLARPRPIPNRTKTISASIHYAISTITAISWLDVVWQKQQRRRRGLSIRFKRGTLPADNRGPIFNNRRIL